MHKKLYIETYFWFKI